MHRAEHRQVVLADLHGNVAEWPSRTASARRASRSRTRRRALDTWRQDSARKHGSHCRTSRRRCHRHCGSP
jgi:hypothetical protein